MKKNLYALIILCSLFLFKPAKAQEATQIALIPFTSSSGNTVLSSNVQNIVASCFANKGRFYLLDRTQTETLKKVLDDAKGNESVYSKIVAEQGHLAGAEYIITGVVGPLEIGQVTVKNYFTNANTTQYNGTLRLSLQIHKVETGQVIFSDPMTIKGADLETRSESDILDNTLCLLKSNVQATVRELFPANITIIQIEKEKNGLPEKVLINSGSEMFDTGKRSACAGSTNVLTGLFTSKKLKLEFCTINEVTAGGVVYKREKPVGQLKIDTVEGDDLSVCSITGGAKEIKDVLDSKKPYVIRLVK